MCVCVFVTHVAYNVTYKGAREGACVHLRVCMYVHLYVIHLCTWLLFPQSKKRNEETDIPSDARGSLSLVTQHVLHSNSWHTSSCWSLLLKCQRTRLYKQRIIIEKMTTLSSTLWRRAIIDCTLFQRYPSLITYALCIRDVSRFLLSK